jgi:hypothetical protein
MKTLAALTAMLNFAVAGQLWAGEWTTYEPRPGPGQGKHIVIVTGDEEYRSEEVGPMLGKILAARHGFKCTVLFALDPKDGTINPVNQTNIAGLSNLANADMMVIFTRFRELPDSQMKFIDDFVNSGKPILGIRTATHAFEIKRNKQSAYARYDWRSKDWPGGFGRQVLGETWVAHHGDHGKESTRGIPNDKEKGHPILRGVDDIWGPSDVYTVRDLPKDATVLVWGQVLEGMKPNDKPVAGAKNNPMMPLIWTRNYSGAAGKTSRVICSTIGASVDCESEGLRRVLVNACYWGLQMEDRIPARSDVNYVGDFKATFFGFGTHTKGLRPSDHALKEN